MPQASTVIIKCPVMNVDVPTGLVCDWDTFNNLADLPRRMTCAACQQEHVWTKDEAWLAGHLMDRRQE
jgi:hypothetical protein